MFPYTQRQPRGSAIFLALVLMIGAAALLAGVMAASRGNVVEHDRFTGRTESFLAAQGMARLALQRIGSPSGTGIGNLYQKTVPPGAPLTNPGVGSLLNYLGNVVGNSGIVADSAGFAQSGQWGDVFAPNGFPYGITASNPAGTKFGSATIMECKYSWQESHTEPSGYNVYFITVRVKAQNILLYKNGQIDPTQFDNNDTPAVLSQTIQISQDNNSSAFGFVTLAKNISCAMCHTSFGSTDEFFWQNAYNKLVAAGKVAQAADLAAKFGQFQRTKIASLGNFEVRLPGATSNPRFSPSDSTIDGTLYSRGIVMNSAHQPITSVVSAALQSVAMGDGQFGTTPLTSGYAGEEIPYVPPTTNFDEQTLVSMQQNKGTGALVSQSMVNPGIDPVTGNPNQQQYANLYLNYPTLPGNQTDGQVPVDFPFPFLQKDPNDPSGKTYSPDPTRLVSTQDLLDMVQDRKNNASDPTNPNQLGTMAGGFAYVVPTGQSYPAAFGNRLPDPSINGTYPPANQLYGVGNTNGMPNGAKDAISGDYVSGNLILVGTQSNPVDLSNQIFVNGDIIVKGYYTGKGSMWATGNIYMPSDAQYKNDVMLDPNTQAPLSDGSGNPIENFGVKSNTANTQNLAGFIAGKTIIIGDYLTASLGSDSNGSPTTNMPPDFAGTTSSSPVPTVSGTGGPFPDPNAGSSSNVAGIPGVDPLPAGSNLPKGYEVSFPLIPAYQQANSGAAYNYYKLDNNVDGSGNPLNPATFGKYVQNTAQINSKNFTLAQMEVFNRDEFAHTQAMLPGPDGNFTQPNTSAYGQQVFNSQTGTYNYDPTKPYLPRYYVLNAGDPVNAFIYQSQALRTNDGQGDGTYYVNGTSTVPGMWQGSEMSKAFNTLAIGGPGSMVPDNTGTLKPTNLVYDSTNSMLVTNGDPTNTQKAAVISLNPSWMPTNTMWNVMLNEEWDRKNNTSTSQAIYGSAGRDGTPLRVDGMLYTNNAIFGIQRNRTLAPSNASNYTITAPNGTSTGPVDNLGNPVSTPNNQPGPYPTPQPVDSYTADQYTGTWAIDEYQTEVGTDNYQYSISTVIYNIPQYYNTYTVTQYTYTWASSIKETDTYTIQTFVNNYYYSTQNVTYTKAQQFVKYSQPNTTNYTYNWLLHEKDQYGNVISPDVAYTTTNSTTPNFSTYNGNTVLSVAPGSPTFTSTNVTGLSTYVLNGSTPPGGYTVTGASITVTYSQSYALPANVSTVPAVPASGSYSGSALPSLPANFWSGVTPTSTAGAKVTTATLPYYSGQSQPPAPANINSTIWSTTTPFSTTYTTITTIISYLTTTAPAYSPKPAKPGATLWTSSLPNVATTSPWTVSVTTVAGASTTVTSYNTIPTAPGGYSGTANSMSNTNITTKTAVYPISSTNYSPVYSYGVTTGTQVSTTPKAQSYTFIAGSTTPLVTPAMNWGPYSWTVSAGYPKVTSTAIYSITYVYTGGTQPQTTNPNTTLYTYKSSTYVVSAVVFGNSYLLNYTPDASTRVALPDPPNVLIKQNFTGMVTTGTYNGVTFPVNVTTNVPRVNNVPGTRPAGFYGPGHSTTGTAVQPIANYPTGPVSGVQDANLMKIYGNEMTSSSRGRLNINGAVIAPDLGLLVTGRKDLPGGQYPNNLILNYDKRIPNLLRLPSTSINPWNYQMIGISRVHAVFNSNNGP